jgi:3-oxoacyl-[acyl-carrier-protein] synthase-1/3-oxoacyl-[acyl-carrier-protein] synthase II
MALAAATRALASSTTPPDAIIIGSTTGGMILTEELLRNNNADPAAYRWHATGTIADYVAATTGCAGPVITVSTACSSGTAVIKLALELIKSGRAASVLAGGVDSLCRLTYYGFNALQLIDPLGARPFDRDRRGMSVAEGAAMLLLRRCDSAPPGALARVLGAGLSCDAHHPAAPHPDGDGAFAAMSAALREAGLAPADISYINLHGTGTRENDQAEARAVARLFGGALPALSSIKGATGHSLAAAGAIEAAVACACIGRGFVPGNVGLSVSDPEIPLAVTRDNCSREVRTVLSNSFGFGGNNAAVVLAAPGFGGRGIDARPARAFSVAGMSCITGAGDLNGSLAALGAGGSLAGLCFLDELSARLPQRSVRRLKRLPRIVLSLAVAAAESSGADAAPSSVSFGTGWGALSETNDFLMKLFETNEEFSSPTDFVGSVHNAPAGQAAILLKSTGPNMTVTGGDCSFEQALVTADLIAGDDDGVLVMGADEYHDGLSGLFDASVALEGVKTDGGGALLLRPGSQGQGPLVRAPFYCGIARDDSLDPMIGSLGGPDRIRKGFGAVFAGMPRAHGEQCRAQLQAFIQKTGFAGPVIDYRAFLGEYATVSSVAAVLACHFVHAGSLPRLAGADALDLEGRGVLLLSLGAGLAAVEIIGRE